jgi:aminoglycoside phosphotransferase (APT) family kinase protein
MEVQRQAISPELVTRLVGAQFPDWASLPVLPVELDGWDNSTFRLGEELKVRLPSADAYVAQVEKEHRWLPVLAAHLPLAIPEPVAVGEPSVEFPRPWAIYRWIDGEPVHVGRITELTDLAADLAAFLTALYAVDTSEGPAPGAHNFFRGGPVDHYDTQVRESIRLLADEIDADGARDAWEAALGSSWGGSPVWVHGDVAPSNLLVGDGRLQAVIDFGCTAVGDPACDLAMAWTFFTGDSRVAFRNGLSLDGATWARGRGWALWKALITLVDENERRPGADAGPRRFGWRAGSRGVIDSVLADHGLAP